MRRYIKGYLYLCHRFAKDNAFAQGQHDAVTLKNQTRFNGQSIMVLDYHNFQAHAIAIWFGVLASHTRARHLLSIVTLIL